MTNLLIGAGAMATVMLVAGYARRHKLELGWLQWLPTLLAIMYATFVVLLVVGFLEEGAVQAALVMSLIMGVPAVIFGVLLFRFVYGRTQKTAE